MERAVAPRDRGRLVRLCKSILRPAICNKRMQRLESGEVSLTLKMRVWMRGFGRILALWPHRHPAHCLPR